MPSSKQALILVILGCSLLMGGCDRVKDYATKLRGDGSSSGEVSAPETKHKDRPAGEQRQWRKGDDQQLVDKNPTNPAGNDPKFKKPSIRNEPISYGDLRGSSYSVELNRFPSRQQSEQFSRELRRKRINNFIYADEVSKSYLVLSGRYTSERQARRQVSFFQNMGYEKAQIFAQ